MSIRNPVVSGFFYPENPVELVKMLEWAFTHPLGPGTLPTNIEPTNAYGVVSGIVPHAGYAYSGPAAAHTYLAIRMDRVPHTIIILGPNHTGLGYPISVYPKGVWKTPLGNFEVDEKIVNKLAGADIVKMDTIAHTEEHSIEVQLPFIAYSLGTNVKIVPIAIMDQRLKTMRELAGIIIDIIEESEKDIIVLASSDMSHYVPMDLAYENDLEALKFVTTFDETNFYRIIEEKHVSACGYGPITVAMLVAKFLGAKGKLLKYYTSGDIVGNKHSVVGYASVVFAKRAEEIQFKTQVKERIVEAAALA